MSQYANLKAAIAANVYENHNNQVTANMVKAAMNAMVDSLGAGYQYMGIAVLTPTPTNPGTPDQRVFYIAAQPGTYTNFSGLVVNDGEVAILKWDTAWHKEVTGAATAVQVTELGQKIDDLALGKFYGFFPAAAGLPAGDDPGYAYVGASSPFAIYMFKDGEWSDSGSVYQPSEGNGEDIDTNEQGKLQFANRPTTYGMGYKILRRNKTFAEQVTLANTIYEIRYDFDLNGASVTIPENCYLYFNGGRILNGVLNGAVINEWLNPRSFGAAGDGITDDTDAINAAISLAKKVRIDSGIYLVDAEKTISITKDNFVLDLDRGATLKAKATDNDTYEIINIKDASNILIKGGSIIGDRDTHTGVGGEHGMGINIIDGEHIRIEDIDISKAWGDAIYIGSATGMSGGQSVDINIANCVLHNCRRQGISIVQCNIARIYNCEIYDIDGTAPEAGIDIESNYANNPNQNITIESCHIYNTMLGVGVGQVAFDIVIKDSRLDVTCTEYADRLIIDGCEGSFLVGNSTTKNEVIVRNCTGELRPYNKVKCVVDNSVITHCMPYINSGITANIDLIATNSTFTHPNRRYEYDASLARANESMFYCPTNYNFNDVKFKNCKFITRSVYGSLIVCNKNLCIDSCEFSIDFDAEYTWWDGTGLFDCNSKIIYITNCVLYLRDMTSYTAGGVLRLTGRDVLFVKNVAFYTPSALGTWALRNDDEDSINVVTHCYMRAYTDIGRYLSSTAVFNKYNVIKTTPSD